jgi:predicted alpha/beta hydrolase family esterase
MTFKSRIFILPGLGNSGEQHWQTLWEKKFPQFMRIHQRNWDHPVCDDWINQIQNTIAPHDRKEVILVAHSLACCAVAYWSRQFSQKIKGALLVAPSDTEADTYPPGTSGFTPVPLQKLPFRSIVVASSNDYYVSLRKAVEFANAWGSEFINIGDTGHINAASSLGEWAGGLEFLKRLDQMSS